MIHRAHTKILSRAPRGLQNASKGQSKDLGTRGAARGLVYMTLGRKLRCYAFRRMTFASIAGS